MVSAVPKDLNLESAGGAGISIMKGLGQVVQQDIASQHPNGVTNGALAVVTLSSPVGRCKAVYLTSLDSWDSEKKVKDTDKVNVLLLTNMLDISCKKRLKISKGSNQKS